MGSADGNRTRESRDESPGAWPAQHSAIFTESYRRSASHVRRDSNPRVAALETAALPLSYGRIFQLTDWTPGASSRIRTCDPPSKSRWL